MFVTRDKKTGKYLKRKNRSWSSESFYSKYSGEPDWFKGLFTAKTVDKAKMYATESGARSFVNSRYARPLDRLDEVQERLEVIPIALCPTGEECHESDDPLGGAR